MGKRREDWLPLKKAAARYGLIYHQLYKLYQRGDQGSVRNRRLVVAADSV